jgi:hypothetical protein
MLPSDFSIVFQPPMVVGQRPKATSPVLLRSRTLWVTTIETKLVLSQLGTLHAEDQDRLRKVLAAIIG